MHPARVAAVPAWRSMADDLSCALDPVLFATKAGITPEPWQQRVLRSSARQQILLCSRQSGKSTVSAVTAIHQALYEANSLILVLAPALRQSQELFRKILDLYAGAGEPVSSETENKLTLELSNGSRIVSLPGKEATIRGFSDVSALIVDEASWVLDSLYMAIRPMLAVSQGRVILLSTPYGRRGFFHHEWTEGGPDWQRTKITAYDCPHIDSEWLEREKGKIPATTFAQEYLCTFAETDDSVFDYDTIRAAVSAEIKPLFARREAA